MTTFPYDTLSKSSLSRYNLINKSYEEMLNARKKIRVLIAKPGLDGHDRGAKVIACVFIDSGM